MKLSEIVTASIDTETTGVNSETDRIITLAIHSSDNRTQEWRFNPGAPIPKSATNVHGITDEMASKWQPFAEAAPGVLRFLEGVQAFVGFNIYGFDLLIITAELARCGITTPFPAPGVLIIDAGTIFKKKEPRTLEAAVVKYCNRTHEGAHGATADAVATAEVLKGQLIQYPELAEMTVEELAKFSQHDNMVDYAGKLGLDDDGEVIYRIGKSRGTRVKDDPGMAEWMLARDFPENTKAHLRAILFGGFAVTETALILCPKETLTPTIASHALLAKSEALAGVALIGKITSEAANAEAARAVGTVTALRRSLERDRKAIKDPYLRACQAIEKAFHSLDDDLAAEELRVNVACGDWKMEQIQRQRDEERKRQAEIDRLDRERREEEARIAETARLAEEARQVEIRRVEAEAANARGKKAKAEAEARRQELERQAEVERVKAEAERKEREALATQEREAVAPVAPVARTEGQRVKPVWTFEVVDSIKLIRGRLDLVRWEPNKEAINEAIATGVRELPGLRIFEKAQVSNSPTNGRKLIDV